LDLVVGSPYATARVHGGQREAIDRVRRYLLVVARHLGCLSEHAGDVPRGFVDLGFPFDVERAGFEFGDLQTPDA
jgi:hypothetical protein